MLKFYERFASCASPKEPFILRLHGYALRDLADQFHAKPTEIKLLFRGQLDPTRTKKLTGQMLMAGLPI